MFPGPGEEVVVLAVLEIRPGGAGGDGVAELGEGFAVIKGEEESVPGLSGEGSGERGGGQRRIKR